MLGDDKEAKLSWIKTVTYYLTQSACSIAPHSSAVLPPMPTEPQGPMVEWGSTSTGAGIKRPSLAVLVG